MKTVGVYKVYPNCTQRRLAEGGKRIRGIELDNRCLPVVTVITVCFNSCKTIERTFESIRNQSYKSIEYIVIDGGSKDGTVDLLRDNEDIIDYFISEPDDGLYQAMNKGLSLASGEFILILNSDDWYENDAIEKLVHAYKISGCDFVGGLARYLNADGSEFILPSMRFDHATLLRMPLRHQTMLIPAPLYDEVGPYDVSFPIIADFDFAIRLYRAKKTYFEVSEPLLNFRTTGVSSTALAQLHQEHKALLQKVFPYLSLEQASIICDHSVATPDDLISVAGAHYDRKEFVLAARDMIADFGRIWGGVWAEADLDAFDRLGPTPYPKISIIMPLYNAAQSVESALQSVLNQEFVSFEVICVNDCSPDDSADRVRRFAECDSRIRLIELPGNIGPGGARNRGVRESRGEYVFFLDADDVVPVGGLSRLFETARANQSDIVRGAFEVKRKIHDRNVNEIKYPTGNADHAVSCTSLSETPELLETTEGHWACLYSRSFVETNLYPEGLSMGEDSLFLINAIVRAKKISTIPHVVYVYQDNETSAMNTYTFKKYMDEVEWRRRAWGILNDAGAVERANYFLFDYWDPSSFEHISERLTPHETETFFRALRDAFSYAGGAVAERCSNPTLRAIFRTQLSVHRLVEGVRPLHPPLKIVVLTSSDSGGAGIASQRCMEAMRSAGQDAFSLSIFRRNGRPNVFSAPLVQPAAAMQRVGNLTALWDFWLDKVALSANSSPRSRSRELFSRTDSIVDAHALRQAIGSVDIVHLHWVVGMLDYANLGELIGDKPVVWTLHDMNAFTGGCHYSEGCEQYRSQCQSCPLLEAGSKLAQEAWRIKKESLAKIRNLHIVCPSQWLADCAARSSLLGDRPIHVIPNFLPVTKFVPTNKVLARLKLGIPIDRKYIAFGADSLANERKGGALLAESLAHMRSSGVDESIECLFFGASALDIGVPARSMGYVSEPERLSLIYAASDVFAFPSLEDNAPQTVVEALLSGTLVVGFPVGNVPDLVDHLDTGYIAHYADPRDFSNGLNWALEGSRTHEGLLRGLRGHLRAYAHHDPSSAVQQHLDLFHSILSK